MKRTALQRQAEILHAELGWFAYALLQRVMETEAEPKNITAILLDVIKDLHDMRRSWGPARPKIRSL